MTSFSYPTGHNRMQCDQSRSLNPPKLISILCRITISVQWTVQSCWATNDIKSTVKVVYMMHVDIWSLLKSYSTLCEEVTDIQHFTTVNLSFSEVDSPHLHLVLNLNIQNTWQEVWHLCTKWININYSHNWHQTWVHFWRWNGNAPVPIFF